MNQEIQKYVEKEPIQITLGDLEKLAENKAAVDAIWDQIENCSGRIVLDEGWFKRKIYFKDGREFLSKAWIKSREEIGNEAIVEAVEICSGKGEYITLDLSKIKELSDQAPRCMSVKNLAKAIEDTQSPQAQAIFGVADEFGFGHIYDFFLGGRYFKGAKGLVEEVARMSQKEDSYTNVYITLFDFSDEKEVPKLSFEKIGFWRSTMTVRKPNENEKAKLKEIFGGATDKKTRARTKKLPAAQPLLVSGDTAKTHSKTITD